MRDSNETFAADLKVGNVGEEAFIRLLEKYKLRILYRSKDRVAELDFSFIDSSGDALSAEVKTCTRDSLSVPLEISSNGLPSGISIVRGAIWFAVYSIVDDLWYIGKREDLYALTVDEPELFEIKKNKKNKSETYIALISKEEFAKRFFVVKAA